MLGLVVYLGSSLTRYVLCERLVFFQRLFLFPSFLDISVIFYFLSSILACCSFSSSSSFPSGLCVCVHDFVFAIVSNHARDTAITLSIAICDSASCFWCTCTHIYIYILYYIILYISMPACAHGLVQISILRSFVRSSVRSFLFAPILIFYAELK